jgi:hypothetical protein
VEAGDVAHHLDHVLSRGVRRQVVLAEDEAVDGGERQLAHRGRQWDPWLITLGRVGWRWTGSYTDEAEGYGPEEQEVPE